MSRATAIAQAFIDFSPVIAIMVVLGVCLLLQRPKRDGSR